MQYAFNAGLSVLRGSYGGMMIFGMIGGMFGLTLMLPVTVGLGLALGKGFGGRSANVSCSSVGNRPRAWCGATPTR